MPLRGFYPHPEQPLGAGEWRKAAEIGLKCKNTSLKMQFYYMDKMKNSISSKHPSFIFENLLVAYNPHEWVWKTSLRTLLNFFPYLSSLDEHCD